MENFDLLQTYVHRHREFDEISKVLTNYPPHLIIEGQPGVGKTTLVKFYSQQNPLNFSNIFFYSGYGLELDESKLASFLIPKQDNKRTLIIIDGFDEIISPSVKERVLRILLEGRKYNVKLIITTRPSIYDSRFESNAYKMQLDGFDEAQAWELAQKYFQYKEIDLNEYSKLKNIAFDLGGIPLALVLAFQMLKEGVVTVDNLKAIVESQLNYKNDLIERISREPQIILPDTPQIIQDVKIVNKRILERISYDPNAIYNLTPRQFEELIAELFEEKGYKVELTPETKDGGKDFLILQDDILGDFLIYAECKKYAPDNPVGVKIVRELYGTITHDRATAGIVVTSSYFSPEAKSFTEKIKHQITLVDFVKLNQWLLQLSGKHNIH